MGKFISCIQCAAVVFLASFALAADEISSVQFEQPSAAYKFDENVLKYNISSKKGTLYSERGRGVRHRRTLPAFAVRCRGDGF